MSEKYLSSAPLLQVLQREISRLSQITKGFDSICLLKEKAPRCRLVTMTEPTREEKHNNCCDFDFILSTVKTDLLFNSVYTNYYGRNLQKDTDV